MKHVIPNNIKDDGQVFGGMLKKRNSIEAGIILAVGIGVVRILGSFDIPVMVVAGIGVVLFLFPAVFALIGLGDQSLTEALGTHFAYRKMPDILEYRLPEGSLDEEEEKPQNMEEKIKQYKENRIKAKEKKAQSKENKKKRKKAEKEAKKRKKKEKRKKKA